MVPNNIVFDQHSQNLFSLWTPALTSRTAAPTPGWASPPQAPWILAECSFPSCISSTHSPNTGGKSYWEERTRVSQGLAFISSQEMLPPLGLLLASWLRNFHHNEAMIREGLPVFTLYTAYQFKVVGVPATGAAGLLFTARQRSDSGVQSLEKKSYSPPTLDSILAYPPIPNA